MYNNETYPVRYSVDAYYNSAPSYNQYGMSGDYPMPPRNFYPMPEAELPIAYPMPGCPMPMPPMPMPPMPMPPMPMPPMPPPEVNCTMYLQNMLDKLMDKKVALVIEGRRGAFECVKIVKVEPCAVIVETRNGVCIIPYSEITAICVSKEIAEEIMGY